MWLALEKLWEIEHVIQLRVIARVFPLKVLYMRIGVILEEVFYNWHTMLQYCDCERSTTFAVDRIHICSSPNELRGKLKLVRFQYSDEDCFTFSVLDIGHHTSLREIVNELKKAI